MVDPQRRARVARGQADRAARRRLHREHGDADLIAVLGPAGSSPGKKKRSETPAAQALLDGATVTCAMNSGCERSNAADLALQPLGALESEADADVVDQAFADRQLALRTDAAAQQDPRRAVRAGGQHDVSARAARPRSSPRRRRGRRPAAHDRRACRRGSSGSRARARDRDRRRRRSSARVPTALTGCTIAASPRPGEGAVPRRELLAARAGARASRARPAAGRARSRDGSSRGPTRRSRPARPASITHALCAEQPPRIRARSCERSSRSVSHACENASRRPSSMSAGQRPSA